MNSNIMQNAINYLAQSLGIQPSELIQAYAVQGQAKAYMLAVITVLCVALFLTGLAMCTRFKESDAAEFICVFAWMGFAIAFFILLFFAYDVFVWISDPRAYAIQEILADIRLWK